MGKTSKTQQMEAKLAKLKEAEWDSGTSDDDEIEESNVASIEAQDDFVKLAKCTKAELAKKQEAVVKEKESNVIYLGHIPHGFYEDQMTGFFKQFGEISKLRMARNRKTGKSKHYAFIEFVDAEVATIVAETMNNYRLFDHVLKCHILPKDQIHEDLFKYADLPIQTKDWGAIAQKRHNQPRTEEQKDRILQRLASKEMKKRKKIQELGIDYEFAGYSSFIQPKTKQQKS